MYSSDGKNYEALDVIPASNNGLELNEYSYIHENAPSGTAYYYILIENMDGKTTTNHAGGVVGGYTNGNEFVYRIAIKPTSSTPKEQKSLNWDTQEVENFSIKGRHDLCVALRAPVIVEAATAIVLADLMMQEQRIKRVL